MMNMHVDVHIGIRTQHVTRVVAFDQAQFGKHLHISVNALDIATTSPRQFTHRQRALPQQESDQRPATFGQPAEERSRTSKFSVSPWYLSACAALPACRRAARQSGDMVMVSVRRVVMTFSLPHPRRR